MSIRSGCGNDSPCAVTTLGELRPPIDVRSLGNACRSVDAMRGLVPGLASPYPLGETLPALYRDDFFAQNLCEGLDEVLAPIIATLDSLPAYLDPATAPDDMLNWLAGWMGIVLDGHQTAERQRELVQEGVDILHWRGTAHGVRAAVGALFDGPMEIIESGGAATSLEPGSALPGSEQPELVVRLGVSDVEGFDVRRLDAIVDMVKPAHVPHRVEVFGTDQFGNPVDNG